MHRVRSTCDESVKGLVSKPKQAAITAKASDVHVTKQRESARGRNRVHFVKLLMMAIRRLCARVCACVRPCVCVCVRMCAYVCAYGRGRGRVRARVCARVRTCAHVCAGVCG